MVEMVIGSYLLAPFQCDTCWFFNIYKTTPIPNVMEDTKALRLIRRANLDMLWCRERNTVLANYNRVKEILSKWHPFRRAIPLPEITAWKVEDQMGMGIAMMTLIKSMEKDRIANCTEFDMELLPPQMKKDKCSNQETVEFFTFTKIPCKAILWRNL